MDPSVLEEIFSTYIHQISEFLPRLLIALFLFLVGWILGKILSTLSRKISSRIGLDEMAQRSGLAQRMEQVKIARSVSDILGILIFWLIFLSFTLVAIRFIGLEGAIAPLQSFVEYIPNLLAAILTLIVGTILAQLVAKAVQAAMAGLGVEFHQAVGALTQGFLIVVTIIISINQLGIDVSLLSGLLTNIVTVIVAGLALSFGLGGREVARNVLAGYYARESFRSGDRIVLDGQEGILEGIGALNSTIRVQAGIVVFPNKHLTETQVLVLHQEKKTPEQ